MVYSLVLIPLLVLTFTGINERLYQIHSILEIVDSYRQDWKKS